MNFAIVGLGKIGIMHTSMVRNVPGARLGALVDRDKKLGRHVQSMMGKPVPFFTSIEEAADSVRLQGALVCTPQFAHRAVAESCLGLGLDVFVEKPLAHKVEDAEEMVATLKKHPDAVTAVGFMKAHEGLTQEVSRLLDKQVIGDLQHFEAACYLSQVFSKKKGWIYSRDFSGGGMVINSTCHLLHTLFRWFGPIQSVTATCRSVHSEEVEDEADVQLEFADITGRLHTSWSKEGYDVETSNVLIQGEGGSLEVKKAGLECTLNRPKAGLDAGKSWFPRAKFDKARFNLSPNYGGEGYYREDEDFVHACNERRPAAVSWAEGLHIQRVVDAIYRSERNRITISQEDLS